MNANTIAGGVMFVFALVYLAMAFQIPQSSFRNAAVGPRALPIVIGLTLAVASLALVVKGMREPAAREPSGEAAGGLPAEVFEEETPPQDPVRLVVVVGLLLAYIFAFIPLGYVISTFLFLLAVTMYLDRAHLVRNVVYSVVFPVLVYFVFTQLLTVALPPGLLGGYLG